MEFRNEVEREMFLGVFGSPFKSMCKLITLKSGVIIIGIYDICIGVICFIFAVIEFLAIINGIVYATLFLNLLRHIFSIAAIPFALIGIKGVNSINIQSVSLYSKYKIIEFLLFFLIDLSTSISRGLDSNENIAINIIFTLMFKVLAGAFAKVVWSAYIRLEYNETVLVMHGEEALKLMQQQAINLANPKTVTPGMPIFVGSPGNIPV